MGVRNPSAVLLPWERSPLRTERAGAVRHTVRKSSIFSRVRGWGVKSRWETPKLIVMPLSQCSLGYLHGTDRPCRKTFLDVVLKVQTCHRAVHQIQSQAHSLNVTNLWTLGAEAQWLPQVFLDVFPQNIRHSSHISTRPPRSVSKHLFDASAADNPEQL